MKSYDEVINIYKELDDKPSKKSEKVKAIVDKFDKMTKKAVK